MLSIQAKDYLLKRLEGEEGFRGLAYDDATGLSVKAPVGKLTIGYGLNLETRGLMPNEAEFIACNIIDECYTKLAKDLPYFESLDEPRKVVLIDMGFNMGTDGVEAFHNTLNLISGGFYKNAAAQMRKSNWYSQLPRRAESLCQMMETGVFLN